MLSDNELPWRAYLARPLELVYSFYVFLDWGCNSGWKFRERPLWTALPWQPCVVMATSRNYSHLDTECLSTCRENRKKTITNYVKEKWCAYFGRVLLFWWGIIVGNVSPMLNLLQLGGTYIHQETGAWMIHWMAQCQAITWTTSGIFSFRPLGTNHRYIWIRIQNYKKKCISKYCLQNVGHFLNFDILEITWGRKNVSTRCYYFMYFLLFQSFQFSTWFIIW